MHGCGLYLRKKGASNGTKSIYPDWTKIELKAGTIKKVGEYNNERLEEVGFGDGSFCFVIKCDGRSPNA